MNTEENKTWSFMKGLRRDIARCVDTGRTGPETYAEAVERALRQESWAVSDKPDPQKNEDRRYTPNNPGQFQANQNGPRGRFNPRFSQNSGRTNNPRGTRPIFLGNNKRKRGPPNQAMASHNKQPRREFE